MQEGARFPILCPFVSSPTAALWFHSLYFVVADAPFAACASRSVALATWNTLEKENMWAYTQRVCVCVCHACMKTQRLVKHGRWLEGVYPGQPLMPVNPMGLGLPYCVLRMNIPMFVQTHTRMCEKYWFYSVVQRFCVWEQPWLGHSISYATCCHASLALCPPNTNLTSEVTLLNTSFILGHSGSICSHVVVAHVEFYIKDLSLTLTLKNYAFCQLKPNK